MQVLIPPSVYRLKLIGCNHHLSFKSLYRNTLIMKRLLLIVAIAVSGMPLTAQESSEKVMEKRAREMHRVIGLEDKEQWKKYIKENFTQALIDKPMRAVAETSDSSPSTSSESQPKSTDKLEAKASMFLRLHEDFGTSKIISIKPAEEKFEMIVRNEDGLSATFILKFDKNKPYLIDGLGIEVQDVER